MVGLIFDFKIWINGNCKSCIILSYNLSIKILDLNRHKNEFGNKYKSGSKN